MPMSYEEFEARESDSIEELDAERAAIDPRLPHLIAAAVERRAFMRALAAERRRLHIPQTEVARRMGTSQAFVSRFERAIIDPQHSTEDRYADAIGRKVERRLVPG
jgi:DNA-binding transcriptional regulator YiaG